MSTHWLVLLAISLESAGVFGLLSPVAGTPHLIAYLIAHAMACALLALVVMPLLPARYRGEPTRAGAFLFTLQFAIPFIGSIGVLLGVLLALHLPRSSREVPWQEVDIPELPFKPIDMDLQVVYSQGGLRQVLREANVTDKRLNALMATRQMADREAIDILREALKDPADDVRLLAYSMLEQKEKNLAQKVGRLQEALKSSDDAERAGLQRRLAQAWWETAYLGLFQGGLRDYYLNSAASLMQELLASWPRHTDWRLLGCIELALGHLAESEAAFNAALVGGSPPEVIMPYLGEIAFRQRNYARVRECLAACAPDRTHPANRSVIESWL